MKPRRKQTPPAFWGPGAIVVFVRKRYGQQLPPSDLRVLQQRQHLVGLLVGLR